MYDYLSRGVGGWDAGRWLPPPRGTSFLSLFYNISFIARYILALVLSSILSLENHISTSYRDVKKGAVHDARHRGGSGWCTLA